MPSYHANVDSDEAMFYVDGSGCAASTFRGTGRPDPTVIAHRLSTVRSADQILVVGGGRIVERGTQEQLLARDRRYAELYDTQFGGGDAA